MIGAKDADSLRVPSCDCDVSSKGRHTSPRQLLFMSLTALHRDVRFDASSISYTDISRPMQQTRVEFWLWAIRAVVRRPAANRR